MTWPIILKPNIFDHTQFFSPVFRPPFEYRTQIYHLITRLVWYSDVWCTTLILPNWIKHREGTCLIDKSGTGHVQYSDRELNLNYRWRKSFRSCLNIEWKCPFNRAKRPLYGSNMSVYQIEMSNFPFFRYIETLRENMGATNDGEENQIREVEVPCCLNIAAALIQKKVL